MSLSKLTLEEVFLLKAFVEEVIQEQPTEYLLDKLNKIKQEILNRLNAV